MASKKKSVAALKREILELEAQLAHRPHFATATLYKAGREHMMGGGVMLQLTAIGGREIIPPVVIKDGLSDASIAALRADLIATYETITMFKPK